MKTLTTLLSGVCFAAVSASCSYAADVYGGQSYKDTPTVLSSPDVSWTGLWLGAVGGMQFSNNALNFDYNENHSYGENTYSYHEGLEIDGLGTQGLFGELQLGYDRQLSNNVVIGLFGGLNIDDGEFKASVNASDSEGNSAGGDITFSQKWGGVVGPRLGYAHGRSLFYVAGGWAFGEMEKIKASVHYNGDSESGDLLPGQETDLSGWFGEVGLEHKLNDNGLSVKVAGRYTDYSDITLFKDAGGNENCNWDEKLTLDRDNLSAMVGLVFRPQSLSPLH